MHVAELWRYPVKSMGGEQVPAVDVTTNGVAGDRVVQVWAGRNRVITARTAPKLLGLRGTWDESAAEPLVNGQPWQSPEVASAVRKAAGNGARLARFEGVERFDVLPLLVATDGAITLLGADRRRLRPNIVIGGVDGLAERQWPGRRLRLGPVIIEVATVRQRCVMTTFDPNTQEQDLGVLRRIVKEFGGRMALDCAVIEGGRLTVGDRVELIS